MNFSFPSLNIKIVDELNHLYEQINIAEKKNQDQIDTQNGKIDKISKNIVILNKKVDVIHDLFNKHRKEGYKNINEIKEYIENVVYLDTNKNNNNTNVDNEILNLLINIKSEYSNIVKEKEDLKLKLFFMENKLKTLEDLVSNKVVMENN